MDKREHLLGDYLRFINTLSATHEAIRSVLASETWFGTLLRIVDIDTTTGVPMVSSLKTRLLALQVLGGIMAELSDVSAEAQAKCSKVSVLCQNSIIMLDYCILSTVSVLLKALGSRRDHWMRYLTDLQ